jgi:hypothetical protein
MKLKSGFFSNGFLGSGDVASLQHLNTDENK